MPELPEVETIKNQLQLITPFFISEIHFSDKVQRILKKKDFDPSQKTIIQISRKGKWLIFELQSLGYILSHLGMSGSWQFSFERKNEKHLHIELIDKTQTPYRYLSYIDPRRFGHFYILNQINFEEKMSKVPIDVSHPDFDENVIAKLFFSFPLKKIKPFLLEQQHFPGVGNYMASEICARAGILPQRLVGEIRPNEIMRIKMALDTVVRGAIETSGTTFAGGYRDTRGEKGEGVKNLVVFYQTYCQLCASKGKNTKVIKMVLSGRGTYYCPRCQV